MLPAPMQGLSGLRLQQLSVLKLLRAVPSNVWPSHRSTELLGIGECVGRHNEQVVASGAANGLRLPFGVCLGPHTLIDSPAKLRGTSGPHHRADIRTCGILYIEMQ